MKKEINRKTPDTKYWHVKLPGNKEMWLKSLTPEKDLSELGYNAFALMQVSGMGK